MSQITRCPACATLFKVVDDQLKVAQGWVRCGQCGEVFEASLHLLADGAGEAQTAPPAGNGRFEQAPLPPPPLPAYQNPGPRAEPALEPAGPEDIPAMASPAEKPVLHAHPAVAGAAEPVAVSSHGDGRQEPVFRADGFDFKPADSQPQVDGPERQDSSVPQEAQTFPEMAFVREAQRKDFWRAPLVRSLLAAVCLVLALALMLQWAVRQKDVVAARTPRLVPWIQAVCRPLGCDIRPVRRIESLVIENSSFSRTGPDAFRLSFTFKNTGDLDLEIPALEITLTDTRDQIVVRRVVMPVEFGATAPTLAAYSMLAGALTLKVAGAASPAPAGFLPVTGYRIVAFYP